MKAAIWTAYGPPGVIEIRDVPLPEPKPGEVRIRVEATSVTAGDFEMRALRLPWYLAVPIRLYAGLFRPKRVRVLGQELAGTVDKVGDRVTRFKPGDKVFAATGMRLGGQAQYIVMREAPPDGMLALRPPSLAAEEAACLPFAAFEARHLLEKAAIVPGEKLLVVGAGGSIGTFAIQIAKARGAEVTAVDRAAKHEMLRSIGADHVVDAAAASYGKRGSFDVAIDVVGRGTFGRGLRALRRGGRYVSGNPRFTLLYRALWARLVSGKRILVGTARHRPEALAEIEGLVAGDRLKPVIGRSFALSDIVAAHRYAESGDKIGNVVVKCG
jgi:NADPH:quinone reductase-like Zn-dependent oxidoreductase